MSATAVLSDKTSWVGVNQFLLPAGVGISEVRMVLESPLTDEQLAEFSNEHRDLRIEQSSEGELIIMPPAFGDTGSMEVELAAEFIFWSRAGGGGKIFGPSTGFKLPKGATLSPDVSWLSQSSLNELPSGALQNFVRRCPDFVLELRSHSDRMPALKMKMERYLTNGVRLGWLLDPVKKEVFVYRPGQPVEHLLNPATLSGEPVLAGFTLDLARIW